MTGTEHIQPEPGPDAGIDDIQDDIDRTRKDLGETVAALSAKLDVKGRVKQKAVDTTHETKDLMADKVQTVRSKGSDLKSNAVNAVTDNEGSLKPAVPVAAFVVVAAVIVCIVIWNRRG